MNLYDSINGPYYRCVFGGPTHPEIVPFVLTLVILGSLLESEGYSSH